MIKAALNRYLNNYKGFSREIWILAIITFINRAGTMVLPFLTKYLKEDLNFSYNDVGWIMVFFGIGSMLGSWLGGKLTDKIGFYKIMIFSLFVSGLMFFVIQFITSFIGLSIGMFLIMSIADMFRPAMFVSLGTYAAPEIRTRALTLIRLSVNLGFAAGPAFGGLIIMGLGYSGLFWVDGLTCVIAISIFAVLIKEKKRQSITVEKKEIIKIVSVFKDRIFWIFLFVCFITAILFFQIITTLPLYDHEKFGLTAFETGLFLTLNGLLIFFLEMPIVSYMVRKNKDKIKIMLWGSLLMAFSFYILLLNHWVFILIISIILITFGEMLIFPFSNSFALSRAPKGHEGRYMAIYTMSFSLAHIFSSKFGLSIIGDFGYQTNWIIMGTLGMIAVSSCIMLKKLILMENL